ncbi:cation:proton antiporter family protein [Sulfuriflexus mobilis]|uniref:cation:proton antiporter family protein n=1 Tax=Sulfuriflexus mobilis TaxID=1811807 RepID=UPI000F81EF7F|nr:cation:proton antiporter family protein [Sulfuriflexus mobilis]
MESILLSIHPSDPVWIGIAFICGFAVKLIGLPPLVGFLFAGFMLNAVGAEGGDFLRTMADLGITLLLFTIGLKLRVESLIKPQVWGVASIHMVLITSVLSALVLAISQLNISIFTGLDLKTAILIGFVLSFSSTVFAIKLLDELGATSSHHGRLAIGILIVQDIAAVVFLAASTGKVPSVWALALLLLIPLRHLLRKVLDHTGHGELLVLYGIVLALGGADIFELVGMKGDVGALILGMLLANHVKASEMAKSLLSFKDLFLVGFFLSVGMTALPGWNEFLVALVFILFLPIKVAFYHLLLNAFKLRASTSWRTSLNLANYSEFGLIVGTLATAYGWLSKEWLAVFAIVLSISFIISAPLTSVRDSLYQRWRHFFKRFERRQRVKGEEDLDLQSIEAVVFGMGRVGTAVYKAIEPEFKGRIVGVEIDDHQIEMHQSSGLHVIDGDATNPDFWARAPSLLIGLKWVLLTLPTHSANKAAVAMLKQMGYTGQIAATSKYDDEAEELKEMGVDMSFNIYAEAGIGFANDLKRRFEHS